MKGFENFTQFDYFQAYKYCMNEKTPFYPENITIKNGKIFTESVKPEFEQKTEKTQNPSNLLMSLLKNNKNMADFLPLFLGRNSNINPEQLSSMMKSLQKNEQEVEKVERKKFEKKEIEDF